AARTVEDDLGILVRQLLLELLLQVGARHVDGTRDEAGPVLFLLPYIDENGRLVGLEPLLQIVERDDFDALPNVLEQVGVALGHWRSLYPTFPMRQLQPLVLTLAGGRQGRGASKGNRRIW